VFYVIKTEGLCVSLILDILLNSAMPQVLQRSKIPLKELCLASIAVNLDNLWCRRFLDYYAGTAHFMYTIGPFDQLPSCLIQDIWVYLKQRKMLRKHHIYLLISPYTRTMDLSHCEADLGLMLLLTSQRCFQLKHLDLSHNRLPRDQLSTSLPTLTCLTSVCLAHTSITDPLLSILGLYCSKLTSLDLSYCTQVSDNGLSSLIVPQDSAGIPDKRFGQCRLLTKLLIAGSQNISHNSILVAVLHLHHLVVLDYHDSVGVVEQLVLQGKLDRKLRLRSLHSMGASSSDSLSLAVSVCSMVEYVYIVTSDNMTSTTLLGLLDLNQIREIHIRNELGNYCLPVRDNLGPVLEAHGETLVSINLAEVDQIDIDLLCEVCHNLIHLVLLWNKSYLTPVPTKHAKSVKKKFFSKLSTVEIAYIEPDEESLFSEMCVGQLCLILLSPGLTSLKLSASLHLTDQTFSDILDENSFQNLKHLELTRCNELSFEGMEHFLISENNLEEVKFVNCEEITKRDFQNYQKTVKKRKWNVKVEWS